jgi:hypothetical protein
MLEYLLTLPGDYMKLALRLLRLANWAPGHADDGTPVDAGEALISYRSEAIWGAVALDREFATDAARVSLLRRVLGRLRDDGYISFRATQTGDTRNDTRNDTRRDTQATAVKWLKYRDSLWPRNADATQVPTQEATQEATHQIDTIPSGEAPAVPATPATPATAAATSPEARPAAAAADGELLAFTKLLEAATADGRRLKAGSKDRPALVERVRAALAVHGEDGVVELFRLRDRDPRKDPIRTVAGFLSVLEQDWGGGALPEGSGSPRPVRTCPRCGRDRSNDPPFGSPTACSAGTCRPLNADAEFLWTVLADRYEEAHGVRYEAANLDADLDAAEELLRITEGDSFAIEEVWRRALKAKACGSISELSGHDVWNTFREGVTHSPEWRAARGLP